VVPKLSQVVGFQALSRCSPELNLLYFSGDPRRSKTEEFTLLVWGYLVGRREHGDEAMETLHSFSG
jgi:hypothetical protein